LEKYAGKLPAVLFALALLDACVIGAAAVSLATAYAIGDVLSLRHSLHRKPQEAKGFYSVYFGLIIVATVLVLTPGTPLGLLTSAVQTLAGVLLPSATVFLLLLSNDRAVLGPWVNSRAKNLFTGTVIAALVMLSIILTASVLFPDMGEHVIVGVLAAGSVLAVVTTVAAIALRRDDVDVGAKPINPSLQWMWRMPPIDELPPARLSLLSRVWMLVLRAYLVVAGGLVLVRIFQLATAHG
jgi:hypothetical protein